MHCHEQFLGGSVLCIWCINRLQTVERMAWSKHPFSYSFHRSHLWNLQFSSLKMWLWLLPERGWGNVLSIQLGSIAFGIFCSSSLVLQKQPAVLVCYCAIAYEKSRHVSNSRSNSTISQPSTTCKWIHPDHRFTVLWRKETPELGACFKVFSSSILPWKPSCSISRAAG